MNNDDTQDASEYAPPSGSMDFGSDHWGYFLPWVPDRSIESNRILYEGIPDIPKHSLVIVHRNLITGKWCQGCATLLSEECKVANAKRPDLFPLDRTWNVDSWDPLTISPSVLHVNSGPSNPCGDHGFIRNGKWESC